jgi:hypothetical protein
MTIRCFWCWRRRLGHAVRYGRLWRWYRRLLPCDLCAPPRRLLWP